MVGLENQMELAETAKKVKNPGIAEAERERQKRFLAQLRERKPAKVKSARAVARPKSRKKMNRARKGETYYCAVCGCEVVCTTDSKSPIVCCDEIMYVC